MTFAPATRPSTLTAALADHAARAPHELAYAFLADGLVETDRLTWAQLHDRALGLAALLRDRLDAGDRALLLLPAGLDVVIATQACFAAGVVGVTVAPPSSKRTARDLATIDRIAADADASLVLTTPELEQVLRDDAADLPSLAALPALRVADAPAEPVDPWWAPPAADDLAYLQYTSGSTSAPRGVMLSHRTLAEHAVLVNEHHFPLSRERGDQGYSWLPPWHDMGLIAGIFCGLAAGTPTRLAPPQAIGRRPLSWLQAISDFGITVSGGPNFVYALCSARATPEQVEALDLSRWHTAFCGAEPIRASTADAFRRTFAPAGLRPEAFNAGYGLAEAALVVTAHGPAVSTSRTVAFERDALARGIALPADDAAVPATVLVECGVPAPPDQLAIVDPQTHRRLFEGQLGELWVSGPTVADGYWRREAETAAIFGAEIDGEPGTAWLRTGDLCFLHEDRLFIAGRAKDVVIVNGVNHHAIDLELVATESHPALTGRPATAFASASADPAAGPEQLVVVIEAPSTPLDEAAAADALTAVRRAIAAAFDFPPHRVVVTGAGLIPKTTSGKVQRSACRDALASGELPVLWEWTAPERSPR